MILSGCVDDPAAPRHWVTASSHLVHTSHGGASFIRAARFRTAGVATGTAAPANTSMLLWSDSVPEHKHTAASVVCDGCGSAARLSSKRSPAFLSSVSQRGASSAAAKSGQTASVNGRTLPILDRPSRTLLNPSPTAAASSSPTGVNASRRRLLMISAAPMCCSSFFSWWLSAETVTPSSDAAAEWLPRRARHSNALNAFNGTFENGSLFTRLCHRADCKRRTPREQVRLLNARGQPRASLSDRAMTHDDRATDAVADLGGGSRRLSTRRHSLGAAQMTHVKFSDLANTKEWDRFRSRQALNEVSASQMRNLWKAALDAQRHLFQGLRGTGKPRPILRGEARREQGRGRDDDLAVAHSHGRNSPLHRRLRARGAAGCGSLKRAEQDRRISPS